jgi:hypothetical protein
MRELNGQGEVVAVTEAVDDVRGCQKNVPFSKPILAVGGRFESWLWWRDRKGGVVMKLAWRLCWMAGRM